MQKNVLLLLSATVLLSCLFTCSNLDTSTNVGLPVVKEFDSTLTTFGANFHAVTIDSPFVTGAASLPDSGNRAFGFHAAQFAAGKSDGCSIFGTASFYVAPGFATRYEKTRVFDSIAFVFDTTYDTTRFIDPDSIGTLQLFPTTLAERYYYHAPESNEKPASELELAAVIDTTNDSITKKHFLGSLADTTLRDSVFSFIRKWIQCDSCYDSCKGDNCEDKCDSIFLSDTANAVFFFSMFTTSDTLIQLRYKPGMIIYSHKDDSTQKFYADTVSGIGSSVTIESDSLVNALSPLPVSQYFSGRTAVFTLNFAPFWDSLNSSTFNEILTAGIVLPMDTLIEQLEDDTGAIIQYFFTNTAISDGHTLSSALDDTTYKFSKSDTSITNQLSGDTIIIDISRQLQQNRTAKTSTFYLYLQLAPLSSDVFHQQQIYWKNPRFKAVLTTIR